MSGTSDVLKRLLVGRALRSQESERELPKRLALPIFASDPLSSVTYATQELLLILTLGGLAYLYLTPYLAAGVVVLLAVVVLSYRHVVRAYPTGGGDYQVAKDNLGKSAGRVVASALLVDYVLTVAVSISAGVDSLISAFEGLADQRVLLALVAVALLTAINLRGVRESGKLFAVPFAIPTYGFVLGILVLIAVGLYQAAMGDAPQAESAAYDVTPEPGNEDLAGLALAFLALRAFASGCTALTGVETIANTVPAFRKPKSENAAKTLAIMGGLAVTMFVGLTALAILADVRYSENPEQQFGGFEDGDVQRSVLAQVAAAVFGGDTPLFFYILVTAAAILVLAANTAFTGFPLLGSVLAQDRNLPRQLHNRGDRLVHSNGIVLLAVFAGLLIAAFDASVTQLIQLYIVGVFTSFTLGQAGMVRHWTRQLHGGSVTSDRRARVRRTRALNAFGAVLTGLVLVIVTVTKFTHGAWLVLLAMPALYLIMLGISRHYDQIARELEPEDELLPLPSRNHAIVLVSKVHAPTLRALSYARATRPHDLTALTVSVDPAESAELQEEWDRRDLPVPLTILDSPYREITRPVLDYVRSIQRQSPRDVVTVYIPEYVVGHWWEQLLHNQSALRLKSRLLFQPGVMVTSVPYQLRSSHRIRDEDDDSTRPPGVARPPAAQPIGRLRAGSAQRRPEP